MKKFKAELLYRYISPYLWHSLKWDIIYIVTFKINFDFGIYILWIVDLEFHQILQSASDWCNVHCIVITTHTIGWFTHNLQHIPPLILKFVACWVFCEILNFESVLKILRVFYFVSEFINNPSLCCTFLRVCMMIFLVKSFIICFRFCQFQNPTILQIFEIFNIRQISMLITATSFMASISALIQGHFFNAPSQ